MVVPNDECIPDVNDRYPHLAALFYHFFPLHNIRRDVVLGERYLVLVEKILRLAAKMARRRRIHGYLRLCCHSHKKLYL